MFPIKLAVWPRRPLGGDPNIYGSVHVRVSVSKTCKSFKCLLPECPPKRYNLLPRTVIVCAFLAIGTIPCTYGYIHIKVSRSRISMSLKHLSPSYPPNIKSLRPTRDIVWQALALGFYPLTFGFYQTRLIVFSICRSSSH